MNNKSEKNPGGRTTEGLFYCRYL